MADAEDILKPVVAKIAEEQEYNDYTSEMSLATSEGANYSSRLYNITLSAPGKDDILLFAKVAVISEEFRSMNATQIFITESFLYTTVLSKYREYEEKYKFPKEHRLVLPKFYGIRTDYMKEVLVLQDVTAKGYQPFDRSKCYDWEYASKCVSYLARLHALSVSYERNSNEEYEDMIQNVIIQIPVEVMRGFIEKGSVAAIDVTVDEYKERLKQFLSKNMTDELFKAYYDSPRKVVLNHGDFRPSNIMHKTNDDGELEIMVVDYQMIHKGNPVEDLLFFLIAGSDENFREKYLHRYFYHYYEEFSRTLRKLEINPDEVYTKEQFDEDVKEILPFGIILGMATLPIITVDTQDAPKIEDGIDFNTLAVEPNKLFRERFNALVRDYVKMRIL